MSITFGGAAISGRLYVVNFLFKRQPSPGRVAVVPFRDTYCYGKSVDMKRNRYRHLIHPLSEDVADRLPYYAAPPRIPQGGAWSRAKVRDRFILSGNTVFVNFSQKFSVDHGKQISRT